MKGIELINLIKKHELEDWDIVLSDTAKADNGWGVDYKRYDIGEVEDFGHSDKIVIIELLERD